MFREKERRLQNLIVELGLKVFTQLDDEFIHRQCRTAFDNWRRLIEDAQSVSVMLWIGDGDEVFNWRGSLNDSFAWNDTIGFNNLKYNAYPPNRHYQTWYARPYIENPPKVTYRDLQRIIAALRQTAKEMFNIDIRVGETIDAGPEFVESPFKFERHPELLEGGPKSRFPKSLAFLCCYAQMKADQFPYATFPQGLPEGTPFGTFLGRQFEHLANAVGFDFVWLSNGFGLTHYAWNYLGEVYNGLECHPERAPESIKNFVSFWKAFAPHARHGRSSSAGRIFRSAWMRRRTASTSANSTAKASSKFPRPIRPGAPAILGWKCPHTFRASAPHPPARSSSAITSTTVGLPACRGTTITTASRLISIVP